MKWNMSLIHKEWGEADDFQCSKIWRLAGRDTNATKSAFYPEQWTDKGSGPNSAVTDTGLTTWDIVSNISDQYPYRVGQNQIKCARVAGALRQRSQLGPTSEYILESLTSVQWVRWSILHWIQPCLAHTDEECTLYNTLSHSSSEMSCNKSSSYWVFMDVSELLCREHILS